MTFRPAKEMPPFADLKGILAQTQIDNKLYQTIEGIIDRLTQFQNIINTEIESLKKDNVPAGTGYLHVTNGKYDIPDPRVITAVGEAPQIFLKDTSQSANSQLIDIVNTSQFFKIRALGDDVATVQKDLMIMPRNGAYVSFPAGISERGRAYVMGARIPWSPDLKNDGGTSIPQTIPSCKYSLVGDMMSIQVFMGYNSPSVSNAFSLTLPSGFSGVDADSQRFPWIWYGTSREIGWAYVQGSSIFLNRLTGTLPAGTGYLTVSGFFFIS